ncbi:hypothetical protein [Methanohalobium sp.]|uniref:hypothetical protein n=1 Tax=Methanohalobium sp. TaxID=2837493 RepID=UPI0025F446EB|nr:hypothetical protein [Methanohalobium sp.]
MYKNNQINDILNKFRDSTYKTYLTVKQKYEDLIKEVYGVYYEPYILKYYIILFVLSLFLFVLSLFLLIPDSKTLYSKPLIIFALLVMWIMPHYAIYKEHKKWVAK